MTRIVSGGQVGAEQGALDAAMDLGFDHGGWCPEGRRDEDRAHYRLREVESPDLFWERNVAECNIVDSDGTLIIVRGMRSGGSALVARLARAHGKPLLYVNPSCETIEWHAQEVREWLARTRILVLHVAGPCESMCPGIQADTRALLVQALSS